MLHQQAGDDGVDADRLARSGCAGDQNVRRSGQVEHNRRAGGVATQRQRQCTAFAQFWTFQDAAQADQRFVRVGHFDADVGPAGHRRFDAHGRRRQRQRQVVGQADDAADAHLALLPRAFDVERLHAELRHRRPALDVNNAHRHVEVFQRVYDQLFDLFHIPIVVNACICTQQIERRETGGRAWRTCRRRLALGGRLARRRRRRRRCSLFLRPRPARRRRRGGGDAFMHSGRC